MIGPSATWTGINIAAWSAGALACLLAAAWLQSRRERFGSARTALVAALWLSGGWGLTGAVLGTSSIVTMIAESLRNLGWIFAIYRLFEVDGRHASMKPVRPMLAALAFVELLQIISATLLAQRSSVAHGLQSFAPLDLLVAIGGLVLTHNLYGGASQQARLVLRWPAASLALLWIVDLNHNAIGFLSGDTAQVTGALRGLLGIPIAGLLVLGSGERSEELRFRPSRTVAFQSISLALIGGYLIIMVAVAQWLALAGSDYSGLLQIVFIAIASIAALVLATSQRLRGWLRVTVIKHLFQHRYDYRAEWLRLNRTIGQAGPDGAPLSERVIRSLADIAECPAGLLLTRGDDGALVLAARWQWPTAHVPMVAMTATNARAFERDEFVADLDAMRDAPDPVHPLPDWLLIDPKVWALVPLMHFDRMVGMVVLARPGHVRKLDWEDFDLLRVGGRQLASYLAEHAGQAALAEASRFDDFHRRIAFVMHDIKNLTSQMGLLARNAEMHADNPEFRVDMLVTLRNSTDKLNALIARLSRYGSAAIAELEPVRADQVARQVVERLAAHHNVTLIEERPTEVFAERDSLEQVLLHLVQNAIDASEARMPVFVSVGTDNLNGIIEVIDSGSGMSPEFVRTRLFKPFESTKPGGFGIGAYEAAELVKAMRGQLDVESREGLGTRFVVRLPLVETAALYETIREVGSTDQKVA